MHGLLIRWADWIVTQPAPDELQASIVWGDHAQLFAAYPFAHTLRMRWKLGQGVNQVVNRGDGQVANSSIDEFTTASTLTVTTIIEADKGEDVPVSFGWHPYLVLNDRANAQLLLPARRAVALAQNGLPISTDNPESWLPAGTQSAGAPLDDLFQLDMRGASGAERINKPQSMQGFNEKSAPTAAIIAQQQRIEMKFLSGYSFMQIYSPAGANFVCFEPMTATISGLCDGAAVVKAGDTFTAAFEIRVY